MGPHLSKKMSGPGLATPPPLPMTAEQIRDHRREQRRRLLREHPSDVNHEGRIICGCDWEGSIVASAGSPADGWHYADGQLEEWRAHRRDVGLEI